MSRRVTVGVVGCGGWCKNHHVPLLIEAAREQRSLSVDSSAWIDERR